MGFYAKEGLYQSKPQYHISALSIYLNMYIYRSKEKLYQEEFGESQLCCPKIASSLEKKNIFIQNKRIINQNMK
jgi:hypothetical protein